MTDRIAIIRNPNAGRQNGPFIAKVAKRLSRAGYPVEILDTQAPGHATEIARDLAEGGKADLIIAAGGDGTIREVATGLKDHKLPVGLIPAGTANVLARELGYLPHGRRSSRHVVHTLMAKNVINLYPFSVTLDGESHLGFCWLGAGFDAAVLSRVSPKLKAVIGRLAFVPATVRTLFVTHGGPDIHWRTVRGQKDAGGEGSCRWLVAANIQRYAGPFILTRRTAVGEPGLACLMMTGRGLFARMLDQLMLALGRLDRRAEPLALEVGTTLKLGGADVPLQLDGDYLGAGEAEVTPLATPIRFRTGRIDRRNRIKP